MITGVVLVLAAGCNGSSNQTEIVLRARGRAPTAAEMRRSLAVVEHRAQLIDSSAKAHQQDARTILVSVPRHDRARAAHLLTDPGSLAFYDLEADVAAPSRGAGGTPKPFKTLHGLLTAAHLKAIPSNRVVIACGPAAGLCPGVNKPRVTRKYYYLFDSRPNSESNPIPQLTGADVKAGGTRQDFDPQTGQPNVLMQLTSHGASEFQKITAEEWRRGKRVKSPQHFAIVLDGEINSWPQIDYTDPTLAGGITGGSARITGNLTVDEAKRLALILRTGTLPVAFVVSP